MPKSIDISPDAFYEQMRLILARSSAEKYREIAANFLKRLPELNIESLDNLPKNTLILYANYLINEGYLPTTVQLRMAGLKRYISWIQTRGIVCPKFYDVDLPRVQRKIKETISPELMQRYIDLVEGAPEPFKTALQLAPFVGLRGLEYVSLTLDSVAIKTLTLKNGQVKSSFMLKLAGKGGDEKQVPVLDEGAVFLSRYLKGWRAKQKGIWLFPIDKRGLKHIADRSFRDRVSKFCLPLGITITPHTFRRTYGRLLYRRGVDPATISKIFGHKKVDTLLQHYLHIDDDDIMRELHGDR